MNDRTGMSRRVRLTLAIVSGLMLGVSFPPCHTGILAAVAFVPFLIVLDSLDGYADSIRFSYLWMLVVHVVALYWTGGFTHGRDVYLMIAGTALLVVHPLFYAPVAMAIIFLRRRFGSRQSIVLFPILWVALEYLLSKGEISFPWLTLGNTQTYDLLTIQLSSITGVYGISLWLLLINVLTYLLYEKVSSGTWRLGSVPAILQMSSIVILYFLPKVYGAGALSNETQPDPGSSVRVGIVQPNIDPFAKWQEEAGEQLAVLNRLTQKVACDTLDLVIWPETAMPVYILAPENRPYFETTKREVDMLGVNLLTGMPDLVYYDSTEPIPRSSKKSGDGRYYDTFNSSLLLQPRSDVIQKYAKTILVPFAERVPYSEELSFLNAMKWNFGLGGWGIGKQLTVFACSTRTGFAMKFSNMICYESVYPGYVAEFVRRGAQFLTIVTNDSWWGNTSGAYQHEQFAVLRAVENRRWIARCANGGISCFIDPYGRSIYPTTMYSDTTIVGTIEQRRDLTFYTQHGDWLAETCLIVTALTMATAFGTMMYRRVRRSAP